MAAECTDTGRGTISHDRASHAMTHRTVPSAVNLPPFQTLLDAHGRDIHRFLVASVGRVDADDCYQETWLAALRAYPKLRDASNLRSWIFTVASRKAIDHGRARRRQPVPVADVPEPAGADPHGLAMGAPGGGIRADDGLWSQVRELPPKQRTALALRYVADAGYDEIATAMDTSEDAARRNVHEALKRLRTEYRQ
jgi:DNA-directed RNA polymerase specialized sigma24 family protein